MPNKSRLPCHNLLGDQSSLINTADLGEPQEAPFIDLVTIRLISSMWRPASLWGAAHHLRPCEARSRCPEHLF